MKTYAVTLSVQGGQKTFSGSADNVGAAIKKAVDKCGLIGLTPLGLLSAKSVNASGHEAVLW